ncbi:MAG: hypothetical protein AAGF12_01460 [Myxococcota bacterium]
MSPYRLASVLPLFGCGLIGFDPLGDAAVSDAPFDHFGEDAPADRTAGDAPSDGSGDAITAPELRLVYDSDRVIGAAGNQLVVDVGVGPTGTIALTGRMSEAVDLGGGLLPHVGEADGFVVVYDADGTFRWATTFGNAGQDRPFAVEVDAEDNVYVTGTFENTLNLGGVDLVSNGGSDAFVVSYDRLGVHRWSQRFGGNTTGDVGFGLARGPNGRFHLSGWVNGVINFGFGDEITDNQDALALSIASDGSRGAVALVGGRGLNQGQDLAPGPETTRVSVGVFDDQIDLSSGTVSSAGLRDLYVQEIRGEAVDGFSFHAGTPANEEANEVAILPDGTTVVGGRSRGGLDLGSGALPNFGDNDCLVFALTTSGELAWALSFGSVGDDRVTGVEAGPEGTVVVSGFYSGDMSVGGMPVPHRGSADGFVLVLGSDGKVLDVKSFGGPESETAREMAVQGRAVYVAGQLNGPVDLGGGLRSVNGIDGFVIRYELQR